MSNNFDPIAYINEPRWQCVSLGLNRITRLLELLGNPHQRLKFVHVAGTNGKGSTCAFLESILRVAGYKTGLFTSPYIETFEERVRVNGENIDKESLLNITIILRDAAKQVEEELGEHPTEFELMTALGFCYFAQVDCDICVIEVGLGGKLDSTNVIMPEVSVITPIGLDHVGILGDTIADIAREKAGIIKDGVSVVCANQRREALEVISQVAGNRLVPIKEFPKFKMRMQGCYQQDNASLAATAALVLSDQDWRISWDDIKEGIAQATWPARFEIFGKVILDGAHNVDGAMALKNSLLQYAPTKKKVAVFGILEDKDYEGVLQVTQDLFDAFYIYEPNSPRALKLDNLQSIVKQNIDEVICCKNAVDALSRALDATKKTDQLVVCFGSLYSCGELRHSLV